VRGLRCSGGTERALARSEVAKVKGQTPPEGTQDGRPPKPTTEAFSKPDLESERVIEQREGIVMDSSRSVGPSDRPEPNVPHPEDLNMMDGEETKGR